MMNAGVEDDGDVFEQEGAPEANSLIATLARLAEPALSAVTRRSLCQDRPMDVMAVAEIALPDYTNSRLCRGILSAWQLGDPARC
jgi:hypothetical protein